MSFAISKLSSPHAHVVVSTPFKDDLNTRCGDVFCLRFPGVSMEESSGEPQRSVDIYPYFVVHLAMVHSFLYTSHQTGTTHRTIELTN